MPCHQGITPWSFSQILFKWLLLGGKGQTLSCTRTHPKAEGRVESTGAPIPPHLSIKAPVTPIGGLLQGQKWSSHITTPPQETPAAFPCIQSHLPPSNGAAHLPLSHLSHTLPHIRGLQVVTKCCGFPNSTAQRSPTQNSCSEATRAEGRGLPLGAPLGTSRSGGKNFVCFSFMHWKASNCTRLFL